MDSSADIYKSDTNRLEPSSSWIIIIKDITRQLFGFFSLTEEDRVKAGIYVDDAGRDE